MPFGNPRLLYTWLKMACAVRVLIEVTPEFSIQNYLRRISVPKKKPNSNPFTFLLFRYGSADGTCRVPGAFLPGFVVVGTEVQTAAHPQAGLHSSWKSFNLINPACQALAWIQTTTVSQPSPYFVPKGTLASCWFSVSTNSRHLKAPMQFPLNVPL